MTAITTLRLRLEFDLLDSQLAALERLNGNEAGEWVDRRDGDHDLLLGLEEMLSEILREQRQKVG